MMSSETLPIIDRLKVGMAESYEQTITDADIKAFAALSGDNNPVHMSEEYAEKSKFKRRIAHGLLSASFFRHCSGPSFLIMAVLMFHKVSIFVDQFTLETQLRRLLKYSKSIGINREFSLKQFAR